MPRPYTRAPPAADGEVCDCIGVRDEADHDLPHQLHVLVTEAVLGTYIAASV